MMKSNIALPSCHATLVVGSSVDRTDDRLLYLSGVRVRCSCYFVVTDDTFAMHTLTGFTFSFEQR